MLMFIILSQLGIDPDIQLKSGWTPLLLAASLALPDVVELLASTGANVNFHKGIWLCGFKSNSRFYFITHNCLILLGVFEKMSTWISTLNMFSQSEHSIVQSGRGSSKAD